MTAHITGTVNKDGDPFAICVYCTPHHIYNCRTCFGYGLTLSGVPVAAAEAESVTDGQVCPECGSGPEGCTFTDPNATIMAAAKSK